MEITIICAGKDPSNISVAPGATVEQTLLAANSSAEGRMVYLSRAGQRTQVGLGSELMAGDTLLLSKNVEGGI